MAKKRLTQKQQTVPSNGETLPIDITLITNDAQLCQLRLGKSASAVGVITNIPPELKQEIKVETGSNETDSKAFHVRVIFTLVGHNPDDQEALRIEAAFEILYKSDVLAEITPEQMNAFGQVVGINNAWPYWREFVQSMSARMGIPLITIPLLRIHATPPDTAKPKKASKSRRKKRKPTKEKK